MKTRQYKQLKVSSQSSATPAQSSLTSRPFAPQPVPEPVLESNPSHEESMAQLERIRQAGHSVLKMKIDPGNSVFPPPLQMKMAIGAPGDKYEQEADRVARQVVSRLHSPDSQPTTRGEALQRVDMPDEDDLQMKAIASFPRLEMHTAMQMRPLVPQLQREDMPDEDELQMKIAPLQREDMPDEDDELQMKAIASSRLDQVPTAMQMQPMVQRQTDLEEETLLQGKFATTIAPVQLQASDEPAENRTGMPDRLKTGLEQLSGFDLSSVRVHYNSPKPAQLNALAYAQGQDIHIGPRQEKHLPHEGWHAVQQMQGRVKPTIEAKGVAINDDTALEREADTMGFKALQMTRSDRVATRSTSQTPTPLQRRKPADSPLPASALKMSGSPDDVMQLRTPQDAEVIGRTHMVEAVEESIFDGDEQDELNTGDSLILDNDDIYMSRRGPNQEVEENRKTDETGEQIYPWYRVLKFSIGGNEAQDVSARDYYIRDDTFLKKITLADKKSTGLASLVSGELTADPDFEQEALKFETVFGQMAMNNKVAKQAAVDMSDRAFEILWDYAVVLKGLGENLENFDNVFEEYWEGLGKYLGIKSDERGKGVAGAVGSEPVDVLDVVREKSNVREQMTIVFNFQSTFGKQLLADENLDVEQFRERLGVQGATLARHVIEMREKKERYMVHETEEGAVGGQKTTRGERPKDQQEPSKRKYEDKEQLQLTEEEIAHMGISPGQALTWAEGAHRWYINEANEWVQRVRRASLPLKAGPSGTTDRIMQTRELLNVSDAVSCRAACLAYLLPINAHSLIEIMVAAGQYGSCKVPEIDPSVYKKIEPFEAEIDFLRKNDNPSAEFWEVVDGE